MPRLQRQLVLFLFGVLIPGAVLLAFGLMLVRQEGELSERRDADALSIRARAVADSLLAGLETDYRGLDSLEAVNAPRLSDAGLLRVGRFSEGTFSAAWSPPEPHPLASTAYSDLTQRAQRAEFGSGNRARAVALLSRGLQEESDSTRIADLELRLSRALFASGRVDEATEMARGAARHNANIVDDIGTPIALYAIELLAAQEGDESLCRALDSVAESPAWLSPEATDYLIELYGSTGCDASAAAGARLRESVLARQVTTLGVRLVAERGDERWTAPGGGWLLRRVDGNRRDPEAVVAIPLEALRSTFSADSLSIAPIASPLGPRERTLAPAFPMIRIHFASAKTSVISRDTLYAAAVALVLFMTVFGGWLLWLDVRRETRLSNLRSQFVASVSHELRTPLTSIRLFAEAMLEYGSPDPLQQEKGLRVIAYESGRLTRMLNNVLNTTRIERGTMTYRRESGDLADAAESAIAAMEYPLGDAGVVVERDLQMARATFDPDAMEQAVLNLLSNALKYAPEGRRIVVRSWEENGHAAVSVRDFGPGVDPEDSERIFERFYRAQRETDLRTTGAGLGLALVRHIADGHEGQIVLHSRPGEGAEFVIQIPRTS